MSTVEVIIAQLGGTSKVAAELPAPVQTVHSWKKNDSIPLWRRPALLDVARRTGGDLPPECWVYLAGVETAAAADSIEGI